LPSGHAPAGGLGDKVAVKGVAVLDGEERQIDA
jgi:hypothetical protein